MTSSFADLRIARPRRGERGEFAPVGLEVDRRVPPVLARRLMAMAFAS
jgi:hypothetical protein